MIKLKKLFLQNYCGFKDIHLDLEDNNDVKNWTVIAGPNGAGKSNAIRAIDLISSPRRLSGRADSQNFLRRLTYHRDYNPAYFAFDTTTKNNLKIEAVFNHNNEDKKVVLENNWNDKIGLMVNELPESLISAAIFIDADSRNNMYTFQLHKEFAIPFLDFAQEVYGFPCDLPKSSLVPEKDIDTGEIIDLYTDFILTKYGNTSVHYKRFSDGEKKIATLLREMFRFCYNNQSDNYNILLIDNIDQHIYFKRHMKMLKKIEQYFPNTQVIFSTHSQVIISEIDPKYLLDLEKYIS